MNYNKTSRKMTARNIVMLIGVVLGIQAGFVSHAMEDNSLQSLKKEIKEEMEEAEETIPLRRSDSFTEFSRNYRLDKVNEYEKDNFSKIGYNYANQEDLGQVSAEYLIKAIKDDDDQLSIKKEEIFRAQKENVEALKKVFDTTKLSFSDFHFDTNMSEKNEGEEEFKDGESEAIARICEGCEMILSLICTYSISYDKGYICEEFKNVVEKHKRFVTDFQKFLRNNIILPLDRLFSDVVIGFMINYDLENDYDLKNNEQNTDDLVNIFLNELKKQISGVYTFSNKEKLDKIFTKLINVFGELLNSKKDKNTVNNRQENDYYRVSLFGMNFLILIEYLWFFSVEQTINERFKTIENILIIKGKNIAELLDSSTEWKNFYKIHHKINGALKSVYGKIAECFRKLSICFDNIYKKENVLYLEDIKKILVDIINKQLVDDGFSSLLKDFEQTCRQIIEFGPEDENKSEFKFLVCGDSGNGGEIKGEGTEEKREQASYLVEEVNGLLKNFNIFITKNHKVELKSLTLGELKNTLNAFKSNSLKKEVFLSDAIYNAFEKKVFKNKSFCVNLIRVLRRLTELVPFFSNYTLQQISEDVKNYKFDDETVEKLANLTKAVSELHKAFNQVGYIG